MAQRQKPDSVFTIDQHLQWIQRLLRRNKGTESVAIMKHARELAEIAEYYKGNQPLPAAAALVMQMQQ